MLLRASVSVLSRGMVITAMSTGPGLEHREMAVPAGCAALAAAVAAAALATRNIGLGSLFLVPAGFACCGWLAGRDLQSGRIPNRLLVPAIAVVLGVVAVVAAVAADTSLLLRAVVGSLVLAVPWLILGLVTAGRGVGGGDVKLAALIGVLTGIVDPLAVETALALSLAAWSVLGLWARLRSRERFLFGPALVSSGLVGIVVACAVTGSGTTLSIEPAALLKTGGMG
jgi:leader peptidase (prepilin peptidase)/N-methyltransferase